jgi:hypothetical protein
MYIPLKIWLAYIVILTKNAAMDMTKKEVLFIYYKGMYHTS